MRWCASLLAHLLCRRIPRTVIPLGPRDCLPAERLHQGNSAGVVETSQGGPSCTGHHGFQLFFRERGGSDVASRAVASPDIMEGRDHYRAQGDSQPATGVEAAAWGRIDWAGNIPLQDDPFASRFRIGNRHRAQ